MTTLMQVASRFLLVWAIVDVFPFLALSPFYSSMLIAWSVTEIIRYSFFALSLSGYQPKFLTWLRYNTFFVLYPIGISSECMLIWFATDPAGNINELYKWALYAILVIYVPGKLKEAECATAILTLHRILYLVYTFDEPEAQGHAKSESPGSEGSIKGILDSKEKRREECH